MKRALVIGASRGLGAHLATRLAEEGWKVTGVGRRPLSEIEMERSFEYLQADLSDPATSVMLAKRLNGDDHELIIYNAVTYGNLTNEIPQLGDMETVFRVNTLVPYRLLLEHLTTRSTDQFSACVVVNSDAIYHAKQHAGVYAASKAALRVLTNSLADACKTQNASVSTLLLGPLADAKKVEELRQIAHRRGIGQDEITRAYLSKSNPSFVIDALIEFEPCFRAVQHIATLGRVANGLVYKLDGGSSGSLL